MATAHGDRGGPPDEAGPPDAARRMNSPHPAGSTFAGFIIERELGSGGMGVVYLARHPRLPRNVALKLLRTELGADTTFVNRFRREAETVAQLDHPNIVGIDDAGAEGGDLWISMRYIDGTTADRALMEYQQGMPPERAVHIVEKVAAALDFAHRHNVVHRDVKPANILLADGGEDEPERVFLSDFGVAKGMGEYAAEETALTRAGNVVATIDYASPEQITAKPLDGRSDQFALGCVLYKLLVGFVPYTGDNLAAKVYARLHKPPPKPSDELPYLPKGFDAVIDRALAQDPADRFPSCRALAAAARSALGSVTGVVPPTVEIRPDPDRTVHVEGLSGTGAFSPPGTGSFPVGATGQTVYSPQDGSANRAPLPTGPGPRPQPPQTNSSLPTSMVPPGQAMGYAGPTTGGQQGYSNPRPYQGPPFGPQGGQQGPPMGPQGPGYPPPGGYPPRPRNDSGGTITDFELTGAYDQSGVRLVADPADSRRRRRNRSLAAVGILVLVAALIVGAVLVLNKKDNTAGGGAGTSNSSTAGTGSKTGSKTSTGANTGAGTGTGKKSSSSTSSTDGSTASSDTSSSESSTSDSSTSTSTSSSSASTTGSSTVDTAVNLTPSETLVKLPKAADPLSNSTLIVSGQDSDKKPVTFAVNTDDGSATPVPVAQGQSTNPVLSADRRTVLLAETVGSVQISGRMVPKYQVSFVASGGAGPQTPESVITAIKDCPAFGRPAWNPDRQGLLAFACTNPDGTNKIILTNLKGEQQGPALPAGELKTMDDLSFSQDGNTIGFWGSAKAAAGGGGVYIQPIEGGADPTLITAEGVTAVDPVWGPGDQIAYSSAGHIFVLDPNGGDPVDITPNLQEGLNAQGPTWSPTGEAVAFKAGKLFVQSDLTGGADLVELADVGQINGTPSWTDR